MKRIVVLSLALLSAGFMTFAIAAPKPTATTGGQIDFVGFQNLSQEVRIYRANRLVTLAQFQTMAREPNTIILDARSAEAYRQGHIAGAINVSLTDFTAPALAAAIKNPNTRILIYCNNNFENNAPPVMMKSVQLALNIQTFINLYGYGYKNVYELGDVVNFNDPNVRWIRGT
ncbi:MAG: rhodanese-like domain-containing protein [Alphaproteobacteria bacterium]|nr:rhodanese-like domain-containing protein [Alphaproteobacteria bacterium]